MVIEIIFWILLIGLIYIFFGYPALVSLAACLVRKPEPVPAPVSWPFVSLVFPAHNEADCIGASIENKFALDYPPDRLEIIVVSDGSTDRTAEIVNSYRAKGVRLVDLPERRGAGGAIDAGIAAARGDIVVTTDANALADPGMVKNLVRHFSDPAVGGVTGDKCILPPQTGFLPEQDEHTYWSYENRLKENEYRVFGSMLSCDNVIFALRKVIFTDPCPPIIGHDFWLSLYISRKGFRIAYDHEAKVFEQYTASLGLDFQRKQRVILGGLQALRLFPDLVWSFRRPGLAFQLASHKILRWLASVLMLALFTVNSLLAGNPLYDLALGLQILFYAVFLTGFLFRGTLHWKPVKLITYFVSVNAASLVALFQYFTRPGNRNPFWEKARA